MFGDKGGCQKVVDTHQELGNFINNFLQSINKVWNLRQKPNSHSFELRLIGIVSF
jgi:hypothetical protein